jgi:hypothetical protein
MADRMAPFRIVCSPGSSLLPGNLLLDDLHQLPAIGNAVLLVDHAPHLKV